VLRLETLARIYMSLESQNMAVDCLEDLLMLNSSNFSYYFKILEAHGFLYIKDKSYTIEEQTKINEILEGYGAKMPKANAHQRIALKYLDGELFKTKLYQYAKTFLVKGVPPFLIDIKDCYTSASKTKIIEDMLLAHLESM
jgi:hypothetical protein